MVRHSLLPVLALGLLLAGASAARAQGTGFGLGLIVGAPTGLSMKYKVSEGFAVDGALGLGFIGGNDVVLHVDALWELDLKSWPSGQLDIYLGIGGKTGSKKKDFLLGMRAPLGAAFNFRELPFDVFVEVAAGLWILEDVSLHADGALGGRYYF